MRPALNDINLNIFFKLKMYLKCKVVVSSQQCLKWVAGPLYQQVTVGPCLLPKTFTSERTLVTDNKMGEHLKKRKADTTALTLQNCCTQFHGLLYNMPAFEQCNTLTTTKKS